MPGPETDPLTANPIVPECGSLKKMFGLCSVGAPTMENAERNINHEAAQKFRDEMANKQDGGAMSDIARSVNNRMNMLNNI